MRLRVFYKRTDALELLKPQILRHDQDLLAMLVRTQDLGTFPNYKYTKICIEQSKKVVCVANYISRLINKNQSLVYRLGNTKLTGRRSDTMVFI